MNGMKGMRNLLVSITIFVMHNIFGFLSYLEQNILEGFDLYLCLNIQNSIAAVLFVDSV